MMEFRPHPYQQTCIDRVIASPAVGLFLRPGLGKTVITLTAVQQLKYDRWDVCKCLVIAPKKVAEATWSCEAAKWQHLAGLRVSVVLGTEKQRRQSLDRVADVYVINRENTEWLVSLYRQNWPFDLVVLDESTSFKNSQSKRFKALMRVRRLIRRMVLLTGTPSSAGLMDLYGQIKLLDGGARLGRTLTAFRDAFFVPDSRNQTQIFSWKPKPGAEQAILSAISDLCISLTAEDYLQLPDFVEQEVPVRLDGPARRVYDYFERDMLLPLADTTVVAATAGVLTGKLLQCCNGAVYDEAQRVQPLHNCKIEAFLELLEALNGEHCLVFYAFQHDKDRLLSVLQARRRDLRVRVYADAADADLWNNGRVDVLLAHPASCAYGLNLQAGGRHVVWFGLNWSFELNDQANCRLYRQGAPYDKVFVHYLVVQNSVDEDVMRAIRRRSETHDAVMSALKARIDRVKSTEQQG